MATPGPTGGAACPTAPSIVSGIAWEVVRPVAFRITPPIACTVACPAISPVARPIAWPVAGQSALLVALPVAPDVTLQIASGIPSRIASQVVPPAAHPSASTIHPYSPAVKLLVQTGAAGALPSRTICCHFSSVSRSLAGHSNSRYEKTAPRVRVHLPSIGTSA